MAQKENDESESKEMENVPMLRSPDFDKKYVTRAMPFFTEFDIRITLSNESMDTGEGWCTVVDEMLILTPTSAKELVKELDQAIKAYEEINGPIRERPSKKLLTTFTRGE